MSVITTMTTLSNFQIASKKKNLQFSVNGYYESLVAILIYLAQRQ